MTVDFDIERVVLRNGGRDIRAEVRMFPPLEHVEDAQRAAIPSHIEPRVTWRGSTSDLVTDLLALIGADKLYQLGLEAQHRGEIEFAREQARERAEQEDGG